jgi:hypothetical protein
MGVYLRSLSEISIADTCMNGWYDSQKQPKSDFRKLVRERIDKANPLRAELTKDEEKQPGRLEEISASFKHEKNVKNRQL